MHKLKIDTQKHIMELDGNPLEKALEATVVIKGGERPIATIVMEADVEFTGDVDVESAHEEVSGYAISSPNCGCDANGVLHCVCGRCEQRKDT